MRAPARLAAALALLLAACGGGSGGGGGTGSGTSPELRFADRFSRGHAGIGYTSFPMEEVRAFEAEHRFTRQYQPYAGLSGPWYAVHFPDTIGIAYARALGLSGRGVTVAVVDDGVRQSHRTFRNTRITAMPGTPVADHGTYVASRIAGAEHGLAEGVALHLAPFTGDLDAYVAGIEASLAAGALIQNNSWTYDRTDAVEAARGDGDTAARLTAALGGPRQGAQATRRLLAAIDRFAEDGVMVFSLDNEPGYDGVPLMAGLPLIDDRYTRAWIAVGEGVIHARRDPLTGLAERDRHGRVRIDAVDLLSQPCREIAHTCLISEGTGIVASGGSDTAERLRRGTSLVAPQVSAALAILKEAFPDAHMHDLRRRLLASANDGFFAADDHVDFGSGVVKGFSDAYGHGVLDLRAALMPIGRVGFSASDAAAADGERAAVGATVGASVPEPDAAPAAIIPLSAAVMVAGDGMGDALARGLEDARLVVRDALGGGFRLPGSALVAARRGRRDGGAAGLALARFLAGTPDSGGRHDGLAILPGHALAPAFGPTPGMGAAAPALLADGVAVRAPLSLGAAEAGWSLYGAHDPESARRAIGLVRHLAPRDGLTVALGLSLLEEREGVLGLRPSGARPRGRSAAIALGGGLDVGALLSGRGIAPGALDIALSAELGWTDAARLGDIGETDTLAFSSFGAALGIGSVLRAGDRLTLSASQPLRVERGRLRLALPSESGRLELPLAPSGRQVDLAAVYSADLTGGQRGGARAGHGGLLLQAGAIVSMDDGHTRGAEAAAAFAGLNLRF